MTQPAILLPTPHQLQIIDGFIRLEGKQLILLASGQPQALLFSAQRVQEALTKNLGLRYEITASSSVPEERIGMTLRVDPAPTLYPQGYLLHVHPDGITITARDEAGLFYGCCTFIQLVAYYCSPIERSESLPLGILPCLEIYDWPDFANRGYLLDISRDKVPTMETLFDLVDLLASWKINQLQLYTEHSFAYHSHPEVWEDASPLTGGEILSLDAYCRERFIELVPNQNSFGHLDRWLKLPRYRHLAEAPDGYDMPWGEHHAYPFSLCPTDPLAISFIRSLYDELLPHFSSRQFNVGCDEVFDLGLGRSKETCRQLGVGRVYLDYLLKIYRQVTQRGFTMQFWADILMQHPELAGELPKDCIPLEWGYDADHPFDEHAEILSKAGFPFYVCPGTSAWNSIAGRTENCLQNIARAAIHGRLHGAVGLLNTDWGDDGHWQALPISYLGIAAGAAYAWSYDANRHLDMQVALSRYAFLDLSFALGNIAYSLGNIYQAAGIELRNTSVWFEILQRPVHGWKANFVPETAMQIFNHNKEQVARIAAEIPSSHSNRPDEGLLRREFTLTAALLRHACQRGRWAFGDSSLSPRELADDLCHLMEEYRYIWLLRNRPGGLNDSLAHFGVALHDYQDH